MLDRTKQNEKLTKAFAVLSTTISFKSKQNMLDDNRVLETVLADLLNKLYGFDFVDLNREKNNHPAIDLGDISRGKAVQITADGSKEKMVETISMLEKYELNKTYKDITFLIISISPKLTFQRIDYKISIQNLADLAKDICSLPTEKFDDVYNFCEKQLSFYFQDQDNSRSIFEPIHKPSKDPNLNISNFMDRSGFIEPYDINVDHVREGLIALKEKLSSLNKHQRWFLYKIMDWSISYNQDRIGDYCAAPHDYMVSGLSESGRNTLKTTFGSLESMKLAYYEHEPTWDFEGPHFYNYFTGKVEDFNLFCGICMFLADNYEGKQLSKIIVDCDFSEIN